MNCRECGGEGRIFRSRYGGNDPDVYDDGECPVCHGSGNERCSECEEDAVDTWREEYGGKVYTYHLCAAHMDAYRESAED